MRIIRQRKIVDDGFLHVPDGNELPASGDVIVSVERYLEQRDALRTRGSKLGVRLRSDQEAKVVADFVAELSVIAIEFPNFKDGRGYTAARLLRDRYGYTGQLRAVGDVLRDQMFLMLRCGFDQFALKHPEQRETALTAYRDFSEAYQTSVERPVPLFARREARA